MNAKRKQEREGGRTLKVIFWYRDGMQGSVQIRVNVPDLPKSSG